jgi:formylglycine-generating enzyme required for sulfatase activity
MNKYRVVAAVALVALLSGCELFGPRGRWNPGDPLYDASGDRLNRAGAPPVAPTGLVATAQGTGTIALIWVDNSDFETGFKVERSLSETSGFELVTTTVAEVTSFDDTGLAAGTTYHYRVCATNAAGDSAYTAVAQATTNAILAPSGLSATALSSTSIRVSWTDNSADETGFKVERSLSETSGFALRTTTAADATSWDDTGCTDGTAYYYRVRATNGAGDSEPSNTAGATTPLGAPSGLVATALPGGAIRLTWTDNSAVETGYKIERSLSAVSGFAHVSEVAAGVVSTEDGWVEPSTTYYYRVKTASAGGDSAYSDTANALTGSLRAMLLVTIAAAGDSFQMGDEGYGPNPTVQQTLAGNYKLGRYEVTNAQYAQFIADSGYSTQSYWTTNGWNYKVSQGWTEPLYWTDASFNGANQPVVGVSWYEAVALCNWRSAREGLTKAYSDAGQANLSATGYRLPTEVEWEYAATKGASGHTERLYAHGSTWDASRVVCHDSVPTPTNPAEVGSESTGNPATTGDTPQGLCDVSGNVLEWCSDNWQADASVTTDTDRYIFVNDSTSQSFLRRGGSWTGLELHLRCAYRYSNGPGNRYDDVGFRVVRRGD